jgi:hypothetical protein
MTRERLLLSLTRQSMAARIPSFCQGPKPLGPTNAAQVSDSARPSQSLAAIDGPKVAKVEISAKWATRHPDSK